MKYVCDVCGWVYDEAEGYPEGGIAPGRIFPKTSSAPCAWSARISSLRNNYQKQLKKSGHRSVRMVSASLM